MSHALKLLLVISDPTQRSHLAKIIKKLNVFEVAVAQNSIDAIQILKSQKINFLVSDIEIGQVDGWRLARMVRSGIFNTPANTPIVLVTSTYCERIAETTARIYGINEVLPYELKEKLPQVLANALSSNLPKSDKLPVLVVEDTEDTAELAKRILKHRFEVDVAANGKEGLALFRANDYAIILLDVMMPELSGHEVLDIIMKEKPNQAVVVMTAHGNMDMAEDMVVKGAADFVQKPFHAEQLRKICEIAARREDFMVSNHQFATKVEELEIRKNEFERLSQAHQKLLDNLSSVVMELDTSGNIQFLNQAWQRLVGYKVEESIGRQFDEFIFSFGEANQFNTVGHSPLVETINKLLAGEIEQSALEFKLQHKNSTVIWVECRLDTLDETTGEHTAITATLDNISARKDAEIQLQHLALHDTLTGLFNRHQFDCELNRLASLASRNSTSHALLYIDLDHFKVINDTEGHPQGDMVLQEVASTLKNRVRESDILCRIGGDEFAILVQETDLEDAEKLATEICKIMAQGHFQFDEKIYRLSCSIGISLIDGHSPDAQEYLKEADIALYVAKKRGRNLVHSYSKGDQESDNFKESIEWSRTLQQAIVNDNIVLHFQPILNIKTGEIAYYEALVRLMIDGKMIFPGDFIPALERVDDIALLDHQVISKAISYIQKYSILNKVAINLSAHAFSDQRLLPIIENKLKEYNVNPERVIFELTESASLTNINATQRMISRLTELGCEFSIDDFGTGFSTFAYLKQIPAHSVKIDGSFVKDMTNDPIDHALVRAIHEVAQSLGKKSVAEFVEDQDILDMLAKIGVDYAQGYHISRPLPVEALLEKRAEAI